MNSLIELEDVCEICPDCGVVTDNDGFCDCGLDCEYCGFEERCTCWDDDDFGE